MFGRFANIYGAFHEPSVAQADGFHKGFSLDSCRRDHLNVRQALAVIVATSAVALNAVPKTDDDGYNAAFGITSGCDSFIDNTISIKMPWLRRYFLDVLHCTCYAALQHNLCGEGLQDVKVSAPAKRHHYLL